MTNDPHPLTLAQLLADLDTLRNASSPSAALSLVSARPSPSPPNPNSAQEDVKEDKEEDKDEDLERAKDLVNLHYKVKVAYAQGEFGRDLEGAREVVRGVVGG